MASREIEFLDFDEADQHQLMLSNEQTDVLRWAVAISRLAVTNNAYAESDCNANKLSPDRNPTTQHVQQ
jgi:hypothetical protein